MQTDTTNIKLPTKKQAQTLRKIWALSIDNFNYSEYTLPKSEDREFFEEICLPKMIKGERLAELWKPLIFLEKTQKQHTDFVFIENAGVCMSQKALDALRPLIESTTEILPLRTLSDNPFFFVNAHLLDVLDEKATTFQYSAVSKTKISIDEFVFDTEKIKNKHFFKIQGFWYYRCISDEFRAICRKHDLKGLLESGNMLWQQKTNDSK